MLHNAAEPGNLEIHQTLPVAGADINSDTTSARAIACRVADSCKVEVFTKLLVIGGVLDAAHHLCHTGIADCSNKWHLEVVLALIAAGANVNALNNFCWKALDLVKKWGKYNIAQILVVAEGSLQFFDGMLALSGVR